MAKGDTTGTATKLVADRNADAPWDSFDSDAYYSHNYGHLRADDKQIITLVADFFQRADRRYGRSQQLARAIDVGSGTNLYPALTMLPYASEITLFERAFSNREWLSHSLKQPQVSWEREFWAAISRGRDAYERIGKPIDTLAGLAQIVKGNVFNLAPGQYGLGTMFFVAESITSRTDEFQRATRSFVGSLVSGAPFAAAFMCNSAGYLVADQYFPACSVDQKDVEASLAPVARIEQIETVDSNDLRDGYCGMIVATGWKR
ncbi:methyltransferase [Actinoplanes sp. TBRC 11911]|uniref:SCO2525 family SAM-dependent methyltransferase n=1 Tax=Actinoplanes sp. TBRC 11911 TaxID=2729386 RepID=UPI00145EC8F0|nr:SCO2525 family SAM-dependent methyltransferase [Actinoplanes sp. TBRC 11911]NMO51522.1 methyltransferase [Actinoplanes sp. TBRC 11911]